MTTLTGRVLSTALVVLLTTLVLVGLVTAGLLHVRARRDLDRALLAAAFAEAHPWQEQRFVNAHVRSPVRVRPWTADDPLVPSSIVERALQQDLPLLVDLRGRRVLLLVVEQPPTGNPAHPERVVVVADAAQVGFQDAALPFLGIYALVAALALLLGGVALRLGMDRALRPLTRAALQIGAVQALDSHTRLPLAGVAEVDDLLRSTNLLLDRLQTAFEAQSSFTASAAHELRTPVTVLKGEIELALRRDRDPAAYRATLERMQVEVGRLVELVEGLMLLTRLETGQAELGRENERLSVVLHRALAREKHALQEAGCPIRVDLRADPELNIHVELAAIAVGNLLRNVAIHAAGSPVVLRTCTDPAGVWVEVEDGGPGIELAEQRRLLDRFQRGSSNRGLGLGLALASEIAQRHGGELRLEGVESGGLLARIRFSSNSNVPVRTLQSTPP